MPSSVPRFGPHENGQNMLVDRRVVAKIVAEVDRWPSGPVTEFAAGRGALTIPLARAGRRMRAIELDPRLAETLRRRGHPRIEVVTADMLRHPVPGKGAIVCNVPFHLTTVWLRRLLRARGWTHALLLVQWEVARKRAGIGGATLLTAQWWPWFEFSLIGRVPSGAFRPRPSVDGGLLRIVRRDSSLVHMRSRAEYQSFVARAFTGPGRGVAGKVARRDQRAVAATMRSIGIVPRAQARDLRAEQWAALFDSTAGR